MCKCFADFYARKIYGHVELHTSAKALALGHSFPRQPHMPGAGTEPAVNSPVRSLLGDLL